jgi:molecular chaperone HscB
VLEARGVPMQGEERENDPAFLMEIMELREALGDARAARDVAKVEALAAQVADTYAASRRALAASLEAHDHGAARRHLGRMRYYRRFLDEVDVIREENELA